MFQEKFQDRKELTGGEKMANLTSQQQAEQRKRIPHKGIDCLSIRVNGLHVRYSCYHHLEQVIADIRQGDEELYLDLWKEPDWVANKTERIVCSFGPEPK